MTSISVIIATKDRQALLAQTLEALGNQTWPRHLLQIIVVDNASTDGTRAVVERAAARPDGAPILYAYAGQPGKSHAVNMALGLARGDLLAFTDDDVLPEPMWLERLAGAIAETGADFVAGRILPRWESPPPSWMSSTLYGVLAIRDGGTVRLPIRLGQRSDVIPIGANMAVRTAVVRRIGGLRPDLGKLGGTLRGGEDHEFFLRMLHAGCEGVYEPSAVVRHWVPRERLQRAYVRAWLYQNGRDVACLEAIYPGTTRLLGIPRYLWRVAAEDVVSAIAAALMLNERRRFAATARLLWLGGYMRERWLGSPRVSSAPALQPAEGR